MALLSVKYDSRLTRNDLARFTKHAELCRYFAPDVVYVVIPREVWIEYNADILKIDSWQDSVPCSDCETIKKKWSKRSKADYNLRSGPIFAVLIHFLLRSLFSFRLERPNRTDITKDSQSMEKISLFLLPTVRFSRPTRFCSIYYYIHVIRHLLTYSLTYRYLLTCAIVCVLVCLFVWLFFCCFWSDLGWFCDLVLCL